MVNFGHKLLESHFPPWSAHYIDYNSLKQVLEDESREKEDTNKYQSSQNFTTLSSFLAALYIQTEKVTFFVLQELGRITFELAECRQTLSESTDATVTFDSLHHLKHKYVQIGENILRLIRFVDLNVTGFRKILKKYDKVTRKNLSLHYLTLTGTTSGRRFRRFIGEELNLVDVGNQLMQPLLQDSTMTAVVVSFEAGLESRRRLQKQYDGTSTPTSTKMNQRSRSNTFPNLRQIDERPVQLDQLLLQIHAALGRLHQTNEFIKLLAVPLMATTDDEETLSKDGDLPLPGRFSNMLNFLSTFLYMTSYYIVAPTSATYADKVGSNGSIASIIVGMTSFAALGSTILYSYWTSYSYKSALIFASACSAIGNLLYACGLPFHSLTLVMLGRLMNGFGSARSINRRYIADSYSYSERTAASAAFVTATALGMAAGPAMASILHLATENSTSVYWQAENAPGFFMAAAWTIFLLCLIWKFEEPPRRHSGSEAKSTIPPVIENGTVDESRPLLKGTLVNASLDENDEDDNDSSCCNISVIVTLVVYMVLKMILEAILSSESNLTAIYFGWEGNIMGVHLTLLALFILPVNFGVAFLAQFYFDRELIIGLLVAMLGGCVIIYQYQDSVQDYTLWQYLIGSAVLFVCSSALEAPNMSLLSKVIPRKWSKGIINVGLLATEAGTFGRVVGDFLLAAMASHGMDAMLNEAFGTFGAIVLATIILCLVFYRHLEPTEKDD